jgi:hypothetical protein
VDDEERETHGPGAELAVGLVSNLTRLIVTPVVGQVKDLTYVVTSETKRLLALNFQKPSGGQPA